jgi:hypothetical protein
LDESGTSHLDWSSYRCCGRIRLYWTIFGGDYSFFRREEEKAEYVPRLSLEYDARENDQYTPQLVVGAEPIPTEIKKLVAESDGQIPLPEPHLISRRFLKISVRNTGLAVAKHCNAMLRVVHWDEQNSLRPSREWKPLRWDIGVNYTDIGAVNGSSMLHVALSDNRVGTLDIPDRYAFVSTPDVVKYPELAAWRMQDGMSVGDFDFELVVRAKTGHEISGIFRVHVTAKWEELAMERIS